MTKAGKIIFASVLSDGKGVVGYFDFDEIEKKFVIDEFFVSDYDFSYLLAIYKNNFSDATIMFIKGAEYSYQTRIVTYYADKSVRDVATVLAYDYTNDTKEIYVKDRAVIVEKNLDNKVLVYYHQILIR